MVERTVIVEVTRVVEVTRLAASTQEAAASGDLPNADTFRVDLTRRMIYDVNGGDIWWVGQVEEIKGLTVLDQTQDGSVLQVEVEMQLTDSQNNRLACATRLTYLHKNGAWSLDRATCHDLLTS